MLYRDEYVKYSKKSSGFALPTVLIASIIMLIVLFSSISSIISVRSAIKLQYYNQLAKTAAEAGLNHAISCLEQNDYKPQWTNEKPLGPDTDCSGNHIEPFGSCPDVTNSNCYLLFSDDIKTSYSVQVDDSINKLTSVTSTGTVGLVRKSDKSTWRQYSKTLRLNRNVISRRSNLTSYDNSCSIGGNARVFCWGDNTFGQIGNGTVGINYNLPQAVKTDGESELGEQAVSSVSVGYGHTCALAADSNVYCWGKNEYGQIGIGTSGGTVSTPKKVHFSDKSIKSIDAGLNVTCAIDSDDKAYCWGSQQYGALGNDIMTDDAYSLKEEPVEVQTLKRFQSISVGAHFVCAIDLDNLLWCWGNNTFGQLGIGSDGLDSQSATPQQVISDEVFSSVYVGDGDHVCAISLNNKAYCWGNNDYGQIGVGEGDYHSGNITVPTAVKADDPGDALYGIKIISISAGVLHTCAVGDNNKVYCWGNYGRGTLGIKTSTGHVDTTVPSPVDASGALKDKQIVGVGAGHFHTCADDIDGYVYCWGDNQFGQLGIGVFDSFESGVIYPSPVRSYSPPSLEYLF